MFLPPYIWSLVEIGISHGKASLAGILEPITTQLSASTTDYHVANKNSILRDGGPTLSQAAKSSHPIEEWKLGAAKGSYWTANTILRCQVHRSLVVCSMVRLWRKTQVSDEIQFLSENAP
jgi:hypothetical protein